MNILSLKRSEIDQNLKNEILNYITDSNIKLDWVSNFKQIMYHFTNKLDHIPKCYCGNFNNFKSSKIGYRKTCSFKCSNSSVDKMEKTKKSKLEKYGDKNYNNMGKNKNSKLEKYGSENYNNRPKAFKTNEVKYGSYSPMKNDAVKKKGKLKKLEKYGNENYNNINKIKTFWKNIDSEYIENFVNKNKKSKLENHGDENYNNSNKMINTKINSGVYIDPNLKSEWNKYRQLVQKFTQRNKKILLNGWDGIDYYDGEVIKENFKHDRLSVDYPTIDHKISIFYGFKNGISAEEISNINNLCITKRYINSTKNYLNELEFKKNF